MEKNGLVVEMSELVVGVKIETVDQLNGVLVAWMEHVEVCPERHQLVLVGRNGLVTVVGPIEEV